MTELMIKMTYWLVSAMVLGFIVAWLLSRVIYKKKQNYAEDSLSAVILERNNMIEKLEKNFRNKKTMFKKVSDNLEDSEKALSEKTSLLTTLQNKLAHVDSYENNSLELKEKNNSLLRKVQNFEQADIKRVKELEEFEEVLVLAEEKIEENEKNYKQILKKLDEDIEYLTLKNEKNEKDISLYKGNIKIIEDDLKLYESDTQSPEFIISKDQFLKIEEQLEIYQKEIESLKNANNKLVIKSQKFFSGLLIEDKKVDELIKKRDDSSMVKVFRQTYKKITKS